MNIFVYKSLIFFVPTMLIVLCDKILWVGILSDNYNKVYNILVQTLWYFKSFGLVF